MGRTAFQGEKTMTKLLEKQKDKSILGKGGIFILVGKQGVRVSSHFWKRRVGPDWGKPCILVRSWNPIPQREGRHCITSSKALGQDSTV